MSVVTIGSKDYPTILRENLGLGGEEQKKLYEYLSNYRYVADEVMNRGEPVPMEPANVVLLHYLRDMQENGFTIPRDLRNAAIAYNNWHARRFAPFNMRIYY
jgi:hypothetical protein